MQQDYVILVNEQDEIIGKKEKIAAHEEALLHRAFSVMLYRKQAGEMEFLLQKRAADKYHCGGLWANTCCSHPRVDETTQAAAERRLQEELGVEIPLTEIGQFTYIAKFDNGLTEHEFDHVFVAEYQNTPQNFNQAEISELKWIKVKELQQALKAQSQEFVPWLRPLIILLSERGYS